MSLLFGRWVLVHAAASCLTALGYLALQNNINSYRAAQLKHSGPQVVLAVIQALFVIPKGALEWLVLRPFQISPWWIGAIVAPTLAVSLFAADGTHETVSTTVLGLSVGLGQWLLLRGHMASPALWVAAIPIAGLISEAVVRAVVSAAAQHLNAEIGILIGLMSELVYALVTGGALLYMARRTEHARHQR